MRKKKLAGIVVMVMLLLVMMRQCFAEEFGWPVPGHTYLTTIYKYSSGNWHSCRYWYPNKDTGKPAGIDIGVSTGTEVLAPASGTVQKMGWQPDGFGNHFEILHDDGTITLYAHLSEYRVENGQRVNRGDIIALSGSTGKSTGPHLHYEMSNRDTYRYYEDNGYRDPRTMNYENDDSDLPWDGSTVLRNRGDFPIKVYTLENRTYDVYSDKYLRNKLTSNWTDGSEEDWILDVGKNSEGVDYAYISIPLDNGNRKNVYVNLRDVFVKGSLNEPTHVYKDCRDFYRRRGSDYDSSYVLIANDATIFPLTRDNGWVQVCFWDWGENGGARIAWLTASEYKRIITDDSVTPPAITTTSLPDAYIGESYSARITATGTTPITYFCTGATASTYGFMLDGRDFIYTSTNAVINGTIVNPTSRATPFTVSIRVNADNSAGSAESKTLSVTVYNLPAVDYSFMNGKTGESYSDYVTVSGGKSPYTWTKQSGTLPDGLSMSPSGSSLYLKGTPTKAGTYNFSLKVKDANGKTAAKSFTVTMATIPSITTASLPDGTEGESYSTAINAAGTTPITFSAAGLPSGLSCSNAGKITGTPSSAGQYTVRISAANSAGSVSRTLTLTINNKPVAPAVDANLPECYVGEEYNGWIRVSGTTPITCTVSGLPSGLSRNSSTGTITGKAASAGTYTIKVDASNAAGSVSKSYSLTVKKRPVAPKITTSSLPDGKADESYSATLSATGTTPISWSAAGLPSGLSCSSTGTISGTPTQSGTYTVKITASNSAGNDTKSLTIKIDGNPAPDDPGINTPWADEQPGFTVHEPILSGQIIINFYADLPQISGVDYNNSYVDFDIAGDKTNVPQMFDPEFNANVYGKTNYAFRCYLNSVQMADEITATLHYGDNKTVAHTYSLKEYIDNQLSKSNISPALKNILEAMKDYGHYAQLGLSEANGWTIGKDHKEMECANVYTDDDLEETLKAVRSYEIVRDTGNSGIESVPYRLRLDSDITLELNIVPASDYYGSVFASLNGGSENMAVKTSGGYLVQISGISAHKLGDTYTVTVTTSRGSFDIKVSALSYVYTSLTSANTAPGTTGSPAMKKAVTSLYKYYMATMAYRESIGMK